MLFGQLRDTSALLRRTDIRKGQSETLRGEMEKERGIGEKAKTRRKWRGVGGGGADLGKV